MWEGGEFSLPGGGLPGREGEALAKREDDERLGDGDARHLLLLPFVWPSPPSPLDHAPPPHLAPSPALSPFLSAHFDPTCRPFGAALRLLDGVWVSHWG